MLQVVGISGQDDTGVLCFLDASRQAPLELEGPREDSAVTGIWSIKQRPSDPWHALMLVSFSTASRAVTAGAALDRHWVLWPGMLSGNSCCAALQSVCDALVCQSQMPRASSATERPEVLCKTGDTDYNSSKR